jgi:N-acetylglucosamine-6-phosphate deacetylase
VNNTIARSRLLYNARIALPETTADSAKLFIKEGRIAQVLDASLDSSIQADSKLDLNGATLFPGFIDMHIHGAVGVDVNNATADDLRRVSEFLTTQGVTAWLPTLVPAPVEQYERAVAAISEFMNEQGSVPVGDRGARVLGVHYEGPFVNSEQCGALHREHFRTFSATGDLDELPTIQHENAVHMMTVAPEINGGVELIGELHRRGWIVSIGHTRATPDVLDKAKDAGAQHMTHFMNAMSPLHHRAPGPVGWGLLNDDVGLDVIADGIHLDPLMLKILLRTMTSARLSLISDAIAATDQGEGEYEIWGEKITVQNGRTRNARGNIAGSVITMLDAVKTMLTLGASECDVARMASSNPARLLGVDRDCGSIEEGKRGDLVALNSNGDVRLTMTKGEIVFDSAGHH